MGYQQSIYYMLLTVSELETYYLLFTVIKHQIMYNNQTVIMFFFQFPEISSSM